MSERSTPQKPRRTRGVRPSGQPWQARVAGSLMTFFGLAVVVWGILGIAAVGYAVYDANLARTWTYVVHGERSRPCFPLGNGAAQGKLLGGGKRQGSCYLTFLKPDRTYESVRLIQPAPFPQGGSAVTAVLHDPEAGSALRTDIGSPTAWVLEVLGLALVPEVLFLFLTRAAYRAFNRRIPPDS